jgi:hypothetical protein
MYIELSQEFSRWAKIRIPDNVRWCRKMSDWKFLWWMEAILGRVEQCPPGPDNVRLGVSVWGSFGKDLESLDLIIFT